MTTSSKTRPETAAPTEATPHYEDDLYGWVEHQVELLKAGRLAEIDAANIAEELSDVAGAQYDKLESALRILLLHFLKWDHQPTHRSRSWVLSISEHRRRIVRVLRNNPSLKPHIDDAIREAYEDARGDVMNETGLAGTAFPRECPYDWPTITARVVEWDDLVSPED